jgi:hypothetical protein
MRYGPTISMVGTPFSISPSCGGFLLRGCQSAAGRGGGYRNEASTTFLYIGRQGGSTFFQNDHFSVALGSGAGLHSLGLSEAARFRSVGRQAARLRKPKLRPPRRGRRTQRPAANDSETGRDPSNSLRPLLIRLIYRLIEGMLSEAISRMLLSPVNDAVSKAADELPDSFLFHYGTVP